MGLSSGHNMPSALNTKPSEYNERTYNLYKSTFKAVIVQHLKVRLITYSNRRRHTVIMKCATVHEQCNHLIALTLLPRPQSHTQAVHPNLRFKAVSLEYLLICLPYLRRHQHK